VNDQRVLEQQQALRCAADVEDAAQKRARVRVDDFQTIRALQCDECDVPHRREGDGARGVEIVEIDAERRVFFSADQIDA
jgi:hypothetical protein